MSCYLEPGEAGINGVIKPLAFEVDLKDLIHTGLVCLFRT